jgi:hypothetical protein
VAGVLLLEGEVEGVVVVAVVFVPLLWFAIQRFASNGLHLTVQAADLSFGHHTMVGPEGGREGGERGERGQERREGGGANLALESCLFRSLILFSKLRRERDQVRGAESGRAILLLDPLDLPFFSSEPDLRRGGGGEGREGGERGQEGRGTGKASTLFILRRKVCKTSSGATGSLELRYWYPWMMEE